MYQWDQVKEKSEKSLKKILQWAVVFIFMTQSLPAWYGKTFGNNREEGLHNYECHIAMPMLVFIGFPI